MTIINKDFKWCGSLSKRSNTKNIVIHHAAAKSLSVDGIHTTHLKNGWAGIGYHFYVQKDGKVYSGRPIDMVGAHTSGHNSTALGICFEGNFENESMNDAQFESGRELIKYVKKLYPTAKIVRHKDLNATACPGKNFPFDKIVSQDITDVSSIIAELNRRGIITNIPLWIEKCKNKSNSYWLAYKICNMTKNASNKELTTINDIVWELNHRGIITDKLLWLDLFNTDEDLYWLGYKAVNMTKNI